MYKAIYFEIKYKSIKANNILNNYITFFKKGKRNYKY